MARVTVEDCVTVVPNRFELCLIANNRAKSILSGAQTTLDEAEKPSVIALREVAEGLVDVDKVRKNVIESTQQRNSQAMESDNINPNAAEEIGEESENPTRLKDNIFLEDNLVIDD